MSLNLACQRAIVELNLTSVYMRNIHRNLGKEV